MLFCYTDAGTSGQNLRMFKSSATYEFRLFALDNYLGHFPSNDRTCRHLVMAVERKLEVQVQSGVARQVDAVGVEDEARDRLTGQLRRLGGEFCQCKD